MNAICQGVWHSDDVCCVCRHCDRLHRVHDHILEEAGAAGRSRCRASARREQPSAALHADDEVDAQSSVSRVRTQRTATTNIVLARICMMTKTNEFNSILPNCEVSEPKSTLLFGERRRNDLVLTAVAASILSSALLSTFSALNFSFDDSVVHFSVACAMQAIERNEI